MRAVDDEMHAVQVECTRHGRLAEFQIARRGVLDAHGLADRLRGNRRKRQARARPRWPFDIVVELFADCRKELDAVVLMRIVRGTDDDAGIGAHRAGQIGNARRRHRPEQTHLGTGSEQTGLQRRFEHVAGNARVLADQDDRLFAFAREHRTHGATELEHEFRGDRPLADLAANAIGSEVVPSAH